MAMTAQERQQRAAERKAYRQEKLEQEMRDEQLAAEAMRSILAHPDSIPAEKIFALEVLETITYHHFTPYESFTKTQINEGSEAQRKAFREEFAHKHPELMKEIESAKKRT